ncbi:MAG: bifunctional diaminohydroxyphosphoribosylaminopyrimidine deaminase/5-amino-6-(5-phosphoribosylamino)uracil reductase RibD [Deltaproteobacteria bacterium]|nr:bifunctional diaminohydroxyphosphoribosylaminopyrimidine deaminase/5-amino-6-(5-phosphoribosylamino)uracil reductase RibD [Deltaproteobacteria bacterium]
MALALRLAAEGRGRTSPNPMVGAVVFDGERVLGEGFHPRAGEPHAEVFALRAAGERARGASMAVTLEPCCHTGRTGPCTDAVIAAGIRRVVVAAVDPNPLVAGEGLRRLEAAGVEVVSGVMAAEAERLNEAFNRWIVSRRPFVTLKLATSLDGRIAARTGSSRWITGPAARARVHALRAASDGVLVGVGTALADDPQLTARDVPGLWDPPARLVVDSQLRLPATARLLDATLPGPVIVATAVPPGDPRGHALAAAGAELLHVPGDDGRVDLEGLLVALGARADKPITSLLVEGGGVLAGALVARGLVDALILHKAPFLLGADGVAAVGPLGLDAPGDAPRLVVAAVERLGDDVEIVAHRAAGAASREV